MPMFANARAADPDLVGGAGDAADLGSPVRQMLVRAGEGPVAIALAATLQATITQYLGHVLALHELDVDYDEGTAALKSSSATK